MFYNVLVIYLITHSILKLKCNVHIYVVRNACIRYLASSSEIQFTAVLHEIPIVNTSTPSHPHNQHTIIQYQFLSLCRSQQLAMPSRLIVVLVSLLLATAVAIFWLWLVIVSATTAMLCPEECQCDIGGYYILCAGRSLTRVPLISLTSVRILRFFRINIKFLENDSFVSLTELEILHVFRSGVKKIELGAFNGLTKVTLLSLWSNEVSEIIPGTFESMSSLENLYLYSNILEHLDSGVFSGLDNIKFIDLRANAIQYIHPDVFLALPKFQQLHLGGNWDLQIPTDRNFINSHSLSYLVLSNCRINSVSVQTFANLSGLERLYLTYNNLRTVDIYILRALPKLSKLYVYDNPLQCDCQLQEVWRWCEEHNIETGHQIWHRNVTHQAK